MNCIVRTFRLKLEVPRLIVSIQKSDGKIKLLVTMVETCFNALARLDVKTYVNVNRIRLIFSIQRIVKIGGWFFR
jgi:hypothetical protein